MWSKDYSLSTDLSSQPLWELLSDIDGWVKWNAGISSITLDGPLAVGTAFRMTPPGEDTITSTIVALETGRLLTDLTEMDGVGIRVEHRLEPHPSGGTTVTYRIEVTGTVPDEVAEEIGAAVSADFPDVIASLVGAAESGRSA